MWLPLSLTSYFLAVFPSPLEYCWTLSGETKRRENSTALRCVLIEKNIQTGKGFLFWNTSLKEWMRTGTTYQTSSASALRLYIKLSTTKTPWLLHEGSSLFSHSQSTHIRTQDGRWWERCCCCHWWRLVVVMLKYVLDFSTHTYDFLFAFLYSHSVKL